MFFFSVSNLSEKQIARDRSSLACRWKFVQQELSMH